LDEIFKGNTFFGILKEEFFNFLDFKRGLVIWQGGFSKVCVISIFSNILDNIGIVDWELDVDVFTKEWDNLFVKVADITPRF
jgi:hypothetical protein